MQYCISISPIILSPTTLATTAMGPSTDPPAVVTPVTAPPAAVPISSRKPLKHRPTDGMTWHLRCGHPSKEALESMVKRATGDEIEAPTTLQCSDCAQAKATRVVSRRPPKD